MTTTTDQTATAAAFKSSECAGSTLSDMSVAPFRRGHAREAELLDAALDVLREPGMTG